MSQTRSEVLKESQRRGLAAGVAAATTLVVGAAVSGSLAAVVAVPAAILGYRWWKYRSENGIKF